MSVWGERDVQESLGDLSRQYGSVAIYAFGSRADEVVARVAAGLLGALLPFPRDIGVLPARGQHLTARDKVRLAIAREDVLDVERVELAILPAI